MPSGLPPKPSTIGSSTRYAALIGIAGGGVVVALMAGVFAASPELFLSPLFQWSLAVVYLVAMLLASLRRPPLPRAQAVRNAFVAYLFVSASYYLYYYLLFEVFEPTLVERQSELLVENARRYLEASPGDLASDPAVIYAPERLRQTVGGTVFNFAQGAIFGAAFSFLLGVLVGARDNRAA